MKEGCSGRPATAQAMREPLCTVQLSVVEIISGERDRSDCESRERIRLCRQVPSKALCVGDPCMTGAVVDPLGVVIGLL